MASLSSLRLCELLLFHFLQLISFSNAVNPGSVCFGDDNEDNTPWPAGVAPGIGVEFECTMWSLKCTPACVFDDINELKNHILVNNDGTPRTGPNWELRVDITPAKDSLLNAEYVLDGTSIKLNTGAAGAAAAAVYNDLVSITRPNWLRLYLTVLAASLGSLHKYTSHDGARRHKQSQMGSPSGPKYPHRYHPLERAGHCAHASRGNQRHFPGCQEWSID